MIFGLSKCTIYAVALPFRFVSVVLFLISPLGGCVGHLTPCFILKPKMGKSALSRGGTVKWDKIIVGNKVNLGTKV